MFSLLINTAFIFNLQQFTLAVTMVGIVCIVAVKKNKHLTDGSATSCKLKQVYIFACTRAHLKANCKAFHRAENISESKSTS